MALRAGRGFAHKRDIAAVLQHLDPAAPGGVPNGDDCAVLPLPAGQGWQLLAIEGLVPGIGTLWDTEIIDVTNLLPVGQTTLTATMAQGSDCVGISAAVLVVAQ